jgi:hypothetical protein
MKRWVALIAVLFAVLPVAGCAGGGPASPAGELAVIDHEMVSGESGSAEVRVTVKNIGPGMAELARVTVKFYDAQKSLIDSSSDSVMNLGAGETWDFKITCRGARCNQVKSYEIETLAGTSSGGF